MHRVPEIDEQKKIFKEIIKREEILINCLQKKAYKNVFIEYDGFETHRV